jgi:hypothetical protein
MLGGRPARVDGDHPAARGVLVRLEPEDRPVVVDDAVLVLEVADQLDGGRVLAGVQVLVEDAVLVVGPLGDGDDQVAAVVGDGAGELPLLLVGAFVDEPVLRLRGAEPVVVQLLVVVGPLQVLAGLRLGEAAVVEAPAVLRPRGARELDPAQVVLAVAAGLDVADLPLLPVGAGRGQAVGEPFPVVADGGAGQGDGAVGRQRVGVEQQSAARPPATSRSRARPGSAGRCCGRRSSGPPPSPGRRTSRSPRAASAAA